MPLLSSGLPLSTATSVRASTIRRPASGTGPHTPNDNQAVSLEQVRQSVPSKLTGLHDEHPYRGKVPFLGKSRIWGRKHCVSRFYPFSIGYRTA